MPDQQPLFPGPMPPAGAEPRPKQPIPREVHVAFWVWVASTLLSVVLQALEAGAFVESFIKGAAASTPEAQLDPGTLRGIYIFGLVVGGLVMLLFAWKMRAGRNWARIVLTVLAVLGLLMQARTVGLADPLALVGVLITAAGLVFMYTPPANAYFAAFRRPRQR